MSEISSYLCSFSETYTQKHSFSELLGYVFQNIHIKHLNEKKYILWATNRAAHRLQKLPMKICVYQLNN